MDSYFVLFGNEDGEVYLEQLDEKTLLTKLNEKDWGDDAGFLANCPSYPSEMGPALLIIRGEIVTPKKREVVTEYELG